MRCRCLVHVAADTPCAERRDHRVAIQAALLAITTDGARCAIRAIRLPDAAPR